MPRCAAPARWHLAQRGTWLLPLFSTMPTTCRIETAEHGDGGRRTESALLSPRRPRSRRTATWIPGPGQAVARVREPRSEGRWLVIFVRHSPRRRPSSPPTGEVFTLALVGHAMVLVRCGRRARRASSCLTDFVAAAASNKFARSRRHPTSLGISRRVSSRVGWSCGHTTSSQDPRWPPSRPTQVRPPHELSSSRTSSSSVGTDPTGAPAAVDLQLCRLETHRETPSPGCCALARPARLATRFSTRTASTADAEAGSRTVRPR